MEEISAFVGEDPAGAAFYQAAARLYERIAADLDGGRSEVDALETFCRRAGGGTA